LMKPMESLAAHASVLGAAGCDVAGCDMGWNVGRSASTRPAAAACRY